MTEQPKGNVMNRVICDNCGETAFYYKPVNSEREFIEQSEFINCKECVEID